MANSTKFFPKTIEGQINARISSISQIVILPNLLVSFNLHRKLQLSIYYGKEEGGWWSGEVRSEYGVGL